MNLNQLQQHAALLSSGFTIDMSKIESAIAMTNMSRRERRRAQFGSVYKFRGLPCSIQPDDKLWCICGGEKNGSGGVLEWCYDEQDAETILKEMQKYPYFSNLHASSYLDPKNWVQRFNAELGKPK